MRKEKLFLKTLEEGDGIVRLAPNWIPRTFLSPGGRLKLASKDLYAFGAERGGIDERWLASTTKADNPGAPKDEGLSYIILKVGTITEKILLKDAINEYGDILLGKDIMRKHGGWMVLTKFFDNSCPIPLHLHQMMEHAKKVNQLPKPEAYYFPAQLNSIEGRFPYTFFGLCSETTKDDIKKCLKRWNKGDNGILNHSKAYKMKTESGWLIPAGILHAPGTMVTYEVQKASDIFAMYQSMLENKPISKNLLLKNVPRKHQNDLDYIIDMIDWEANLDPEFKKHHYLKIKFTENPEETRKEGYEERWIIYGTSEFSAKQLVILPNSKVKIYDDAAYGLITIQGHGIIGKFNVETPILIRYNELSNDELFVTVGSAKEGVEIINESSQENMVILKHFGPDNVKTPRKIS
jgi:hypothetical protein